MHFLMSEEALELAVTAAEEPQLFFEPIHFLENLSNMGIGMVVIFAIISVIILATSLINYLFSNND